MNWSTVAAADPLATPDQVWSVYTRVARWPEWDLGLARCTIDGPFHAGTGGTLQPKGGPALRYRITAAEPGRGFSDQTPIPHALLPLAVVHLEHELTPLPAGGTRITHRVRFSGVLGRLAARLMTRGFEQDLPESVRSLATYACTVAATVASADAVPRGDQSAAIHASHEPAGLAHVG